MASISAEAKNDQAPALPTGITLIGMGNPLLDISANVGQDLFDKYGVLAGNAILAEEFCQELIAPVVAAYEDEKDRILEGKR